MKFLLDTHTFLWWVTDDRRVSKKAGKRIADRKNELFFSAASAWEIAIKTRLGRLKFSEPLESFLTRQLEQNHFQVLPVTIAHGAGVASLPQHHRDPFDHMLISQSRIEDMPLLSGDDAFDKYDVSVIW